MPLPGTVCICNMQTRVGHMYILFTQLLTDTDRVYAMTHTEKLTSVHSELQVSHESAGLVGKCVVDIEAPERVQLDKSRLSVFLKANSRWPSMRVEKKGVFSD